MAGASEKGTRGLKGKAVNQAMSQRKTIASAVAILLALCLVGACFPNLQAMALVDDELPPADIVEQENITQEQATAVAQTVSERVVSGADSQTQDELSETAEGRAKLAKGHLELLLDVCTRPEQESIDDEALAALANLDDSRASALAFAMIEQELGNECVIVSSEDGQRFWNLVKIGEAWYHTDAWAAAGEAREATDDEGLTERLEKKWLLVGSNIMLENDDAYAGWLVVTEGVDPASLNVSQESYAWEQVDGAEEADAEPIPEASGGDAIEQFVSYVEEALSESLFSLSENSSCSVSVEDYIGVYDGLPHTVIASSSGGVIYYRVDEPFEYDLNTIEYVNRVRLGTEVGLDTTAPSLTSAGSIVVYYLFIPSDANIDDVLLINKYRLGKTDDISESRVKLGTAKVQISPKPLSSCTVTLSPSTYTYDGAQKNPALTVKDGSTTLTAGTHYAITAPAGRTNAATYTYTATGKGNYTGTKTATMTISQATPTLRFASQSVSKRTTDGAFTNALTKTTDGTVTFSSSSTSVATVNGSTGQVTVRGAGTATITANASAGTNYKAGSASYTLTVTAPAATIYTVSYDANGGTGTPSPQTKEHNVTLTLSAVTPTKSYVISYNSNGGSVSPASKSLSCAFRGWNTSRNGSGSTYAAGASYTANSNATLYAQWTNPTAGTLATPTRSGYGFEGWYTSASGGTKVTSTTAVTANMTVYAHWSDSSSSGGETYSAAYLSALNSYIGKYGSPSQSSNSSAGPGGEWENVNYATGVCLAHPIDYDGDGQEDEMLVCYATSPSGYWCPKTYYVEVWQYRSSSSSSTQYGNAITYGSGKVAIVEKAELSNSFSNGENGLPASYLIEKGNQHSINTSLASGSYNLAKYYLNVFDSYDVNTVYPHQYDNNATVSRASHVRAYGVDACIAITNETLALLRSGGSGVVFADVSGSTPHIDDIRWLSSVGISEGWVEVGGLRTFRGMDTVRRQDMAAFLYRMAGSPAYVPSPADVARFADVGPSTPHHDEIWWLASTGISSGWEEADGTFTFRGMDTVKRQDMAAFLRRLTRRMGADDSLAAGADNPFSDVDPASTPHAEDILWLASVNVTTGWEEPGGARTYRGMADVVRQDMAAFLHRLDGHISRTRG